MYRDDYSESVWSRADLCTHALAALFRPCCQEKSPKQGLLPCCHGNTRWEAASSTRHGAEPLRDAARSSAGCVSPLRLLLLPCCARHHHHFWGPVGAPDLPQCGAGGKRGSCLGRLVGMERFQAAVLMPPTCTAFTLTQLSGLCGVGSKLHKKTPNQTSNPKVLASFRPHAMPRG